LRGREGHATRPERSYMRHRLVAVLTILAVAAASCGGSSSPRATPTPPTPPPEDAIRAWVAQNRNVDYLGDCAQARPGVDVGKLCSTLVGTRGRLRAYHVGPTFSEYTALAMLQQQPDDSWSVLSVTNRNPSAGGVPGIPWPLEVGDQVVVVGVGEGDCLSVRAQPTQAAQRQICIPDGTTAIIQEGPVDAETFRWWRIAGEGFDGWSVDTWLRLPEAIAQALQPDASPTAPP